MFIASFSLKYINRRNKDNFDYTKKISIKSKKLHEQTRVLHVVQFLELDFKS